ncbi:hypothetical protein BT67DRAFT_444230 [Trichocladium antarcticum]|uniref:Uncharacterized protein n=1 Tax=Trichocladium antarcticum TaxID=1450529 RepID=A0AAN6ZB64_9PEZI|nr:hypothetical protein BT67DRAFT_444230 [Trichocladium antarcticum]
MWETGRRAGVSSRVGGAESWVAWIAWIVGCGPGQAAQAAQWLETARGLLVARSSSW